MNIGHRKAKKLVDRKILGTSEQYKILPILNTREVKAILYFY